MADNLVSQPPLNISMIDSNGMPSKAWAVWFRDLYRRTSYKGGNAIDDIVLDLDGLEEEVDKNTANIEVSADKIAVNEGDILALQNSKAPNLTSQIQQIQRELDGLPEFTIDTTGFTVDSTLITVDKVLA